MAQAAPAPGGMSRPGRTPEVTGRPAGTRARPPDVFDARAHRLARIAGPVVLGLVYGYWAAANRRFGGPITGGNVLFGFLTALVFAVVCAALLALAPRLRREVHALAWSAFAGAAFGFLYIQSTPPVWGTVVISLLIAAGTFGTLFYRYYTREDAAGHRIR
ncbi:hypothetical protein [Streptomyces sp. NRRL S-31]|uniref:hypothetical protein n=1 Tax=Streptomyces sp. NRRL S-31 TaxID=1463898 RepID=UPI0004CA927E|nr:hypothetical protein [Streptomyces sp. NRRL S-31]